MSNFLSFYVVKWKKKEELQLSWHAILKPSKDIITKFLLQMQTLMRTVWRSEGGRHIPDTRLLNWRKNFILIGTWHAVGGLKSHMPCVWQSDRLRSGFKIGGWSGKRIAIWPLWMMQCRCIKCIPLWHISTIITYNRPWACTLSDLNTLILQRAILIHTVSINNCYEQNKQTKPMKDLNFL